MMILLSRLILLAIIVYLVADVVYPAFSNKEFWWMLKELRKKDEAVEDEGEDEASEDSASSGSTDTEEESK